VTLDPALSARLTYCTNVHPADFWGERGYDWYIGH